MIRIAACRFDPDHPNDPERNVEFYGQAFDVQASDEQVKLALLRAIRGLAGSLVMDMDGYRKA